MFRKIPALFIPVFIVTLIMSTRGYTREVTVIGSIPHALKHSDTESLATNQKIIQLLHIKLNGKARERLVNLSKDALAHTNQFLPQPKYSSQPSRVYLEMNQVPVLNQGNHGTCVTFAITGALDALLGQGNYISQVCNLQLGSYLELHGYSSSGWEGSYSLTVIRQIEQYGIVNKQKQHANGCGGLTHYPTYSSHDKNSFIEPEKYHPMSEPIFGNKAIWSDIFNYNNPVKTLENVKQALNAKDRLVFSVLLPRTDLGSAGAVGKHKTWIFKDTWVLTPEILKDVGHVKSAHEMIITGYDDQAEATDNNGKKHKGLLKLRNSWGYLEGDYGDYYMSYDYFKLLAYDVKRFSRPSI